VTRRSTERPLEDRELDVSEHATTQGDLTWLGALLPASEASVLPLHFVSSCPFDGPIQLATSFGGFHLQGKI